MKKKSQRRFAREKVLQALYAYQLNGEGLTKHSDAMLREIHSEQDREFGRKLINSVAANDDELSSNIKERVSNWEIERIAVIDKILLKMGIAEILYFEDIPPKVSINEVIDMSKEFSSANSGKFINGILDAILTELKKEGKLNKVGRGLIDKKLLVKK
ncbi:MAG: transcription antitermination factor NusB [Melioribacteraceae bacterium]|nr:transcription antitermination factor NusB [Melioribacteraceae bacterium]